MMGRKVKVLPLEEKHDEVYTEKKAVEGLPSAGRLKRGDALLLMGGTLLASSMDLRSLENRKNVSVERDGSFPPPSTIAPLNVGLIMKCLCWQLSLTVLATLFSILNAGILCLLNEIPAFYQRRSFGFTTQQWLRDRLEISLQAGTDTNCTSITPTDVEMDSSNAFNIKDLDFNHMQFQSKALYFGLFFTYILNEFILCQHLYMHEYSYTRYRFFGNFMGLLVWISFYAYYSEGPFASIVTQSIYLMLVFFISTLSVDIFRKVIFNSPKRWVPMVIHYLPRAFICILFGEMVMNFLYISSMLTNMYLELFCLGIVYPGMEFGMRLLFRYLAKTVDHLASESNRQEFYSKQTVIEMCIVMAMRLPGFISVMLIHDFTTFLASSILAFCFEIIASIVLVSTYSQLETVSVRRSQNDSEAKEEAHATPKDDSEYSKDLRAWIWGMVIARTQAGEKLAIVYSFCLLAYCSAPNQNVLLIYLQRMLWLLVFEEIADLFKALVFNRRGIKAWQQIHVMSFSTIALTTLICSCGFQLCLTGLLIRFSC